MNLTQRAQVGRGFIWLLFSLIMASNLVLLNFASANDAKTIKIGGHEVSITVSDNELVVLPQSGKLTDSFKAEVLPAGVRLKDSASGRISILEVDATADASRAVKSLNARATAPVWVTSDGRKLFNTGMVIVIVDAGVSQRELSAIASRHNCSILREASGSENGYLLSLANPMEVLDVIEGLRTEKGILEASSNYIDTSKQLHLKIDDPLFSSQWTLKNIGQSGGLIGEDANIGSLWNVYLGSHEEEVAVIDSYVDITHEDLYGNVNDDDAVDYTIPLDWTGGANSYYDPQPGDYNHGTAVASIIAARGGNNIGLVGVMPRGNVVGHRVFDELGFFIATEEETADALSRRPNGIKIYNNSWGFIYSGVPTPANTLTKNAIDLGIREGRNGLGSIYVFSAGNDSANANYSGLTNDPRLIIVSATDNLGNYSTYSSFGSCVLVNAPSNAFGDGSLGVIAADLMGDAGDSLGNYITDFGGTSASAPLVSGVIGLMLQANPNLTWQDVRHILLTTAQKNDIDDESWDLGGVFSYSDLYGFGRVDATGAVETASEFISAGVRQPTVLIRENNEETTVSGGTLSSLDFEASQSLFVEYVEINLSYSGTGDLELVSPSGSVCKVDYNGGVSDWPFAIVRPFGEPSRGVWSLRCPDGTSTITRWTLKIYGRPDVDNSGFGDGLPDDWERNFFGTNANLDLIEPDDDPNGDGKTNWEHFVDGTDPNGHRLAVYKYSEKSKFWSDGQRTSERYKGYLVNDQSSREISSLILLKNGSQRQFYEQQWGRVTETGETAVLKFFAESDKTEQEVIASVDYFDIPPEEFISDQYVFRYLRGKKVVSGQSFGLSRGSIAKSLKGTIMTTDIAENLFGLGKLSARLDKKMTTEVNRPNLSHASAVKFVKTDLLIDGYFERKLTVETSANLISEAAGANAAIGTVTRSTSTSRPLTLSLTVSNPDKIIVPQIVTIPQGSASTTFAIDAVDDLIADGNFEVEIRASVAEHTPGRKTVTVVDND